MPTVTAKDGNYLVVHSSNPLGNEQKIAIKKAIASSIPEVNGRVVVLDPGLTLSVLDVGHEVPA